MRPASTEVVPFALPFREPYVTSRGTLQRREMVLLRVRDPDGVEGLGEAVPLSLRGGPGIESVVAELRDWDGGADIGHLSPPACCAVETALLDLRARAAGVPAWRELGAEGAEPVRCNATLTAGEPEAVAEQARSWAGEGFGTFKLKVGVPGDVGQVRAVREAVGDEARIRVDANGAWTPDLAIAELLAMNRISSSSWRRSRSTGSTSSRHCVTQRRCAWPLTRASRMRRRHEPPPTSAPASW